MKTALSAFRLPWLWAGAAAALLLGLALVGNVLVIGDHLGRVSPFAMWVFYSSAAGLLLWLLVCPALALLRKPALALQDLEGTEPVDSDTLRRIANELLAAKVLPQDQAQELERVHNRGGAIRELLTRAIQTQSESAREVIQRNAIIVFVSTALSQNGRLDALAVLITNARMIGALAAHFGCRPSARNLGRIYAQTIVASLVADSLEDLDLPQSVGPKTLEALGVGMVASSVVDGAANALLTLRIGFVARACLLNAGRRLPSRDTRQKANREARASLELVAQQGLKALSGQGGGPAPHQ